MTKQKLQSRLVVVDHLGSQLFKRSGGCSLTILPLVISVHAYQETMATVLKREAAALFPVSSVAGAAAREIRLRYPEFVYREIRKPIGRFESLLELLDCGEVNYWWFTEASEKSPIRTSFINQLYRLAVVSLALESGKWEEICVSLQDQALARAVAAKAESLGIRVSLDRAPRPALFRLSRCRYHSFWLRIVIGRLAIALRTLVNSTVLKLYSVGRPCLKETPLNLVVSWYPNLYSHPETPACRERIIGNLIEHLRAYGPVWQVVYLDLWPWQLLRRVRRLASVFASERIVPLPLFNIAHDALDACFGMALWKSIWRWRRVRHTLKVFFGEWDITDLWREEIDRSLSGYELMNDFMVYRALRRVLAEHQPKLLIHRCEFQPTERAIWAALRGTKTRSVAFQHSSESSNSLHFYFAEGELTEALENPDRGSSPMPDYFIATGDAPLQTLRAAGFPEYRSTVVGPLRYDHLVRYLDTHPQRSAVRLKLGIPGDRIVVLVTPSMNRAEALGLVKAMRAAVPHLPTSVLLLFKPHYNCRIQEHIARAFSDVPPDFWRNLDTDADLAEHLRASDAVVLTSSTTCLEAIVLSCHPIIFDAATELNLCPLIDSPQAALFAESPEAIAKAIGAVCRKETRAVLESSWPAVIARNFHTLDTDAGLRLMAWLEDRVPLGEPADPQEPGIPRKASRQLARAIPKRGRS